MALKNWEEEKDCQNLFLVILRIRKLQLANKLKGGEGGKAWSVVKKNCFSIFAASPGHIFF